MKFAQSSFIYSNHSLQFAIRSMGRMGYDGIAVWGGRPHMYRQDLHAQLPEIRDLLDEYGMAACHVVPAQFRYPSLLASSNEKVRRDSVRYIMDNVDNALLLGAPSVHVCAGMSRSRKINTETDTTLSLVDILMASTSFPIAFPSVSIRNVSTIPDVKYIDGGVGDDHIPFQALLDYEKSRGIGVDTVYIVSRKSDSIPEVSEELRILGLNDRGLFDKLGVSLDNILYKGFMKRLEAFASVAPDLIPRTYVWIPDFRADFLMFSFSNLKEQFDLTTEWAVAHTPVPLSDYMPYNQTIVK